MGWTKRVLYAIVAAALLLLFGTLFFHQYESWSYVDSFYFATMTLTTIGYGDLAPTTDFTKIFTSFYSILGIGVMLYLLTAVIGSYLRRRMPFHGVISKFGKLRKSMRSRLNNSKKDKPRRAS